MEKRGFTLIELLAVIVILALIALITIPAVLRITENAKVSSYRRSIDLYGRAISTAIQAYKSDKVEKRESYQINFDNVIPYVDYEGYDISCESKIYSDETILLTKCSIENDIVYAEKGKGYGSENYYYYTNSKKRIKALLYIEAVNKALEGKENIGNSCQIENSNLTCNNQPIEVLGELGNPKSGILIITNNQVTSYSNLKFEDEKVQTGEEVPQVVDQQEMNTNPNNDNNDNQNNTNASIQNSHATLIQDKNGNGKPDVGDKYSYRVNNSDIFHFYVLSIEGDKVNLIMDSNICEDGLSAKGQKECILAWYDGGNTNEYGPVTAMNYIYNATKNWNNVPDMNLDYSDEGHIINHNYGYGRIEISQEGIRIFKKDGITEVTMKEHQTPVILYEYGKILKARLPKYEEVYNEGTDTAHCHEANGTCPVWLVENLKYYNTKGVNGITMDKYEINKMSEVNQNIQGYWTMTSRAGSLDAHAVDYFGRGTYNNTSNTIFYGVRPVITVPKSYLQ